MGNLQTGFSIFTSLLFLFLGLVLNRLPKIWKNITDEDDRNIRIINMIIFGAIFFCLGLALLIICSLGFAFITTPDLPTSEPVNVSININSTNCAVTVSNIDCTPTFSCERYCPRSNQVANNCQIPPDIKNEKISCNQITVYRPIILSLPIISRIQGGVLCNETFNMSLEKQSVHL